MGKFHCIQCKSWIPPRKMYMVQDHLWEKYGVGKGMLCVECFEKRLGRKLEPYDLSFCYVNTQVNPYTMWIFARLVLGSNWTNAN